MIGKHLLLSFWIIQWIHFLGDRVGAQSSPKEIIESDEQNDLLIFQSVVKSMKEWESHKKSSHRNKREVSSVCYDGVGCFEDTGPFSYLEMLPSAPKDVGTRFFVYGSRKARSIPMEVSAEDISEKIRHAIDVDLPTKVLVHGFGSDCDHIWVYEMRSALMQVQDCNVVCVDWSPGSTIPNYVRAAANTRLVGRQLAKLVRSLDVPLDKLHLIGFSLGAHVAGFAGAELGNVSRITGLDPAGPLFESQDPRARLDEQDAQFVDVIHSNGEQLLLGGLGSWQPMGDVDFYPNGGRMQSGCSNIFLGAVTDIIWSSTLEGRSLCNHRRAYKLFTDSVSPKCRFPAFPCHRGYDGLIKGDCFPCGPENSDRPCGDMGFYSDSSPGRGQLYLMTRDEEPFCANQYQVKVFNSRSERATKSYGNLKVTLVGEGSFNETFTMTRKDDEELLVGAILQKIVVPHPVVTNLEAIEIKYTAYHGWISSGLITWNIDKVLIVDSFGKTTSICKRGLSLESGKSVYLRLQHGDCIIQSDIDNVTIIEAINDKFPQEKQGGIGPFTRDQNWEKKETISVELLSNERISQKGLGPFTKDQNPKPLEKEKNLDSKIIENTDSTRNNNRWTYIDISDNGESNSLENLESESGRAFSSSNFIHKTTVSKSTKSPTITTEAVLEIQEPLLKVTKKETARSMKLPEITEPILKSRSTRQNIKGDSALQNDRIEMEESSTTTRSFTVQFLPERLAGILAQAEKYARQTLLPLISQYTPSFVGIGRNDRPKYFPPLGDIADDKETKKLTENSNSDKDFKTNVTMEEIKSTNTTENENVTTENVIQSKKQGNDWIPINRESKQISNKNNLNTTTEEKSLTGLWLNEDDGSWTPQSEDAEAGPETKIDDWVPITDKIRNEKSLKLSTVENTEKSSTEKSEKLNSNKENSTIEERKFIPLTNLEEKNSKSSTHIQRIAQTTVSSKIESPEGRSVLFPYVYERKNDPRTRYIPLIPEEDLGISKSLAERDR
ncbi:uncharacterized protein LOC127288642 [Leptopilina boulardi]|uniref:uncharacterized protein LOC127288642 n=1 Tax=Leptopilina boulardi TaxID=63433 RepID=UPI0021F688E1|nr:uncharacterized protein LOC127288642 [Leptopilina boulardi]